MRVVVLSLLVVAAIAARSPTTSVEHEIPDAAPKFSTQDTIPPLLVNPTIAVPNDCTYVYNPPSGAPITFNLGGMTKGAGDYKGQDPTYDYKSNVCAPSNAGPGCTDKGYTVCQYQQQGGTFVASLGSYTQTPPTWSLITLPNQPPETPDKGVMYTMTNGDICWIAGRQQVRTVLSVFRCASATTDLIAVAEDSATCTFILTFQSSQACTSGPGPTPSSSGGPGPTPTPGTTTSGGISGGTIFLIMVAAAIPLYIAGGCFFNVKKKSVPFGREACPNSEFWTAFPGYVKAGCMFTYTMIRTGCKKGGTYEQM